MYFTVLPSLRRRFERHFNLTRIDRQQVCNLREAPFYAGGGFLDKKFVGPLVIRAGLKDTAPDEERVLG